MRWKRVVESAKVVSLGSVNLEVDKLMDIEHCAYRRVLSGRLLSADGWATDLLMVLFTLFILVKQPSEQQS